MKKWWYAFVCILVVGTLFITGCNSKRDNRHVMLTVTGWNLCSDIFQLAANDFEKMHPGVQVDVRYADSNYMRILPRLMAGTEIPDVMLIQAKDAPALLNKYPDMFLDLTSYVNPSKSNFMDASWDAITKDGKIYGLPTDMGPAALFYRADLFAQAGIDPDSIETWDEFIAAGQKMKAATNGETSIIAVSEDGDLFDMMLNQVGGNYVSNDDKTVVINSPEAVKAINLVRKLIDSGAARDVKDWGGRIVAMKRNQVASVPYGVWFGGTLAGALPEQAGKWKVMPFPAHEKGGLRASNCGGSVVMISKNCRNPEVAWEYINYLYNTDEGQKIQVKNGLYPAYMPIYKSEEFNEVVPYFGEPVFARFTKIGEENLPFHRGPISMDSTKAINDMVQGIFSDKSPEEVLAKAAKDIAESCNLKVEN